MHTRYLDLLFPIGQIFRTYPLKNNNNIGTNQPSLVSSNQQLGIKNTGFDSTYQITSKDDGKDSIAASNAITKDKASTQGDCVIVEEPLPDTTFSEDDNPELGQTLDYNNENTGSENELSCMAHSTPKKKETVRLDIPELAETVNNTRIYDSELNLQSQPNTSDKELDSISTPFLQRQYHNKRPIVQTVRNGFSREFHL